MNIQYPKDPYGLYCWFSQILKWCINRSRKLRLDEQLLYCQIVDDTVILIYTEKYYSVIKRYNYYIADAW